MLLLQPDAIRPAGGCREVEKFPVLDSLLEVASPAGAVGLLGTALALGLRHGIDWDHIAAITDITSTTAAGESGAAAHEEAHRSGEPAHDHGGSAEQAVHGSAEPAHPESHHHDHGAGHRATFMDEQRRAILLGSLYALGHGLVVAVLGAAALLFGAVLPDWVDPIMGRVVGVTLIILGVWVFYSVYTYFRHGTEFRLRSRWMLAFASARYGWRWFRAKLHGHDHVDPVEASTYGSRTAFGVGMIHGIGAETGTQVLIIAAVGGAASAGLGLPMMVAFIVGLLISNTAIVLISATGFVASQLRQRIYLVVGVIAGAFSLVIGLVFLLGADAVLPALS
jgi:high-affinity nickel-transport protein